MSLLPIIYTSLAIFLGGGFLMLTIGYTMHKIKNRHRKVKQVPETAPAVFRGASSSPIANASFGQSVVRAEEKKAKIVVRKSTPPLEKEFMSLQESEVGRTAAEKKIAAPAPEIKAKPLQESPSQKKNERNFNSINRSASTRIEIMNHNSKFKTLVATEKYIEIPTYSYSNKSEMNLFDFYSDKSGSDFVALSAVKVARAV